MVEVEVNGSIYSGRLICINATEESFVNFEGIKTIRNSIYLVRMMDANGVYLDLSVTDATKIKFVG